MSLGRNGRDAQFPNVCVHRDAVVGNELRAKSSTCCYLHATARSRHASITVDPHTIDAVIGPVGILVPDGSLRFDTLQDAVAHADGFTDGKVYLNVPAGDYTAEGIIATSNSAAKSSLHICGPAGDYYGNGYVDNQEIAGSWTGSGSGVATVTFAGTTITVTAAGTNPDFQTAGVQIGDRVNPWLDGGVTVGPFFVTDVAPTVLTMNAAVPAPVPGQAHGFAFVAPVAVAGYSLTERQGDVNIERQHVVSTVASGSAITAENCRVFVDNSVVQHTDSANPDHALHFSDSKVPYVEVNQSTVMASRGLSVSHSIRGRVVNTIFHVPASSVGSSGALHAAHGARVMLNGRVVMVGIPNGAMINSSDGAHLMAESGDHLHAHVQIPTAGGLAPVLSMRNVSLASLGNVHVNRYDTYAAPGSYSMRLQGSSKLHVQNLQSILNNGVGGVNVGSHVYANTDSSMVVQSGRLNQGRYGMHGEGHAHLVGSASITDNTDTLAVMVGSNVADGGAFANPRTNVADGTAVLQGGVRYVVA